MAGVRSIVTAKQSSLKGDIIKIKREIHSDAEADNH
jgi:hypothetical protein